MTDTAKFSIEDRVRKVVCDHLAVEPSKVVPTASFLDDLGADSLDVVELIMTMEEEFELSIPDDEAQKIKTVNDVLTYLKAKGAH